MEKKTLNSSSVKLPDKYATVDTGGEYELKSENCDEFGRTVWTGKSADAALSSKTVHVRNCQHQKQHRSADRKHVAEDHEVLIPDAHVNQSIAGKTLSSCCDTNSVQLISCLKHVIHDNAYVNQPPQQLELSVLENSSGAGSGFCCSKCGCRFRRLKNFMQHGEQNCRCTCRKSFEDRSTFQRHRVTHRVSTADTKNSPRPKKPSQYICSHCGRLFKTTTTLNTHVMTHTGDRPLVCRIAGCGKHFTQHSTRSFHERTHSDDMPHICAVCGRRFKHAIGVRLHMSVHTGSKPHHCTSCPMVFRRACDLQRHSLTHSAQRPYSCLNCQKCFKTKKTLDRHILALHSDVIPWHCSVCDKGFKTSGNLHVHMRVHTGDRPYACAVCGARFSYSGSLKSHMRVHSGCD